jgi:transcriptional regulator with XRE-family HTH domain
MTIGKRIKKLRLDNNISAKDLAFIVGIAKETLSNWETDKHEPSRFYIPILAKALNTTTDYIAYGEEVRLHKVIKDKSIEEVTVTPRFDETGYYFQLDFTDGSSLRVVDKILFKNKNDKNYKEIMY